MLPAKLGHPFQGYALFVYTLIEKFENVDGYTLSCCSSFSDRSRRKDCQIVCASLSKDSNIFREAESLLELILLPHQ